MRPRPPYIVGRVFERREVSCVPGLVFVSLSCLQSDALGRLLWSDRRGKPTVLRQLERYFIIKLTLYHDKLESILTKIHTSTEKTRTIIRTKTKTLPYHEIRTARTSML
jgi:hypothetical protein